MILPQIKHFNPNHSVNENDVFALSKGLNTGKPLKNPGPNCFVIHCLNWKQKELYQSILYAAWKTKAFEYHLCGSVIPFIHIDNFKKVLHQKAENAFNNYDRFKKDFKRYIELDKYEKSIKKQLELIEKLKTVYISRNI